MADDAVILLSSDDSCENAFVTPHRWDAKDVVCPEAATTPAGSDDRTEHSRLIPSKNLSKVSPATWQYQTKSEIIEIDDATDPLPRVDHPPCRPPLAAWSGFEGFSSDDLPSSPLSCNTKDAQKLPPSRPLAIAQRSPPRKSAREMAALAAIQRLESSRAVTDGCTDYNKDNAKDLGGDKSYNLVVGDSRNYDSDQDRPVKRLRLSPTAVSVPKLASTIEMPACVSSNVTPKLRHSSYDVHSSRSSTRLPRAQRLLQRKDGFDAEDDGDAPTIIRDTRTDKALKSQYATVLSKNSELVDLLSSSESDSEIKRTRVTTKPLPADSNFVDIDDLLLQDSPQTPGQRQTKRRLQQKNNHKKQSSDNTMLLSSSPIASPVEPERSSSSSRVASSFTIPVLPPNRSMQSSSLERQITAFSDDEDSEDAIAAEAFLADWRKTHPEISTKPRAPSYKVAASPARKRKQPIDEEMRSRIAAEKEQRQKDKEAERERRAKEKEIDRERRKIASEQAKDKKAKERAEAVAFNNANKSRVDKAVAAPEMIVRLPTSMSEATRDVIESMLTDADISHELWASMPLDNVVTWRRKVSNEYKPDLGHWVPVPTRIEDETYALVVLRSEEFVNLIVAGQDDDPDARHAAGGHNLASHVAAMRSAFMDNTIVYLVEGLQAWRNKKRTMRNRQFVAAVHGNGHAATGSASGQENALSATNLGSSTSSARPSQRLGRRGQKQALRDVDEALVDESLFDLQMDYNGGGGLGNGALLVHETSSGLDTARWIHVFTEQIATGRYRQHRETLYAAAAPFCMDSGQIATGDDPQDLYALILQQVARVTEPVALGVATQFDSIPRLVRGFQEEGSLALEAVPKSRNRTGALSDRTIGPALSRRLHKVFLGRDAASTDV
ncbi:hypothetical protein SEPCBS57363_002434 [Sporothrix epigloea]|uniref:ERCC4 domain-containing protein n=1 Tax=Sporothrix epigloea TaxID=1892477 RepID=A0ABP0DJY6_9PEZI